MKIFLAAELSDTLDEFFAALVKYAQSYGGQILAALVILVLGRWLAQLLTKLAKASMTKAKIIYRHFDGKRSVKMLRKNSYQIEIRNKVLC